MNWRGDSKHMSEKGAYHVGNDPSLDVILLENFLGTLFPSLPDLCCSNRMGFTFSRGVNERLVHGTALLAGEGEMPIVF